MALIGLRDDGEVRLVLSEWYPEGYLEEKRREGGVVDDAAPTAGQLGNLMDEQTEGENYHSLVGSGSSLARLLVRHVGEAAAVAIIREIVENGGLVDLARL